MSARRDKGGDLKDSKEEEGGEEAVAMAEAEAVFDSEINMGYKADYSAAHFTLNAESNRGSKKRMLSTIENSTSNEFFDFAKPSSEMSGESETASLGDELVGYASAGGKVGGGAMQPAGKASLERVHSPESAHRLALTSGTSGGDKAVAAIASYKSVISSMVIANKSNGIAEENYYLVHWLYRIRNVSCRRGLRISFLQPDFLWSIYSSMMRGKKYLRTNADIRLALNAWCSNRASAEGRYGPISDWDVSSVTEMRLPNAASREILLRYELAKLGCALRNDSSLCAKFVQHGRGDPASIAVIMKEMKFYCEHTRYQKYLAKEHKKFRDERSCQRENENRHDDGDEDDDPGGYQDDYEPMFHPEEASRHSKDLALKAWVAAQASSSHALLAPILPFSLRAKVAELIVETSAAAMFGRKYRVPRESMARVINIITAFIAAAPTTALNLEAKIGATIQAELAKRSKGKTKSGKGKA